MVSENKIVFDEIAHLHYLYSQTFENQAYWIPLTKDLTKIFKKVYNKQVAGNFQEEEFQDFIQDLLEELTKLYNTKTVFDSPRDFYFYLFNFSRINLKTKTRHQQLFQTTDFTGLSEDLLRNSYGYRPFMIRLYLQDVIKVLIEEFQKSLRFIGNERKICLSIFDSLLKDVEINVEFLERRYNLKASFYIQHVKVLVRKVLYQLRALGYSDLNYLMEG